MATIPFDVNDPRLRDAFLRTLFLQALAPLREDARPHWGRMTAQQMVEHLAWTFEVSTGRARVDCPLPEPQRERLKAFLYHNRPTPPEFMNPALADGLPPLRHGSLAEAKEALRLEVGRFLDQSADTATYTHPLFGPMGAEQWQRSHFKHCYHHLLQFGLVDGTGEAA